MNDRIKPFKKHEEKIEILRKRNLIIDDVERAKIILSSSTYYELINGYKGCFDVNEDYRNKYTLEFLDAFYYYDHGFQNILFLQSVFVETSFKSCLSYIISEKYGIYQNDYLDKKNFRKLKSRDDKDKFACTINQIKYTYSKYYKGKKVDEPTLHYILTKDHIPAWILLKNVTFSNSINLYTFLKREDKLNVIKLMVPDLYNSICINNDNDVTSLLNIFSNSLTIVRKFRNVIAHNLQFIRYKSGKYSIDKNFLIKTVYNHLLYNVDFKGNDIYSMMISLLILTKDLSVQADYMKRILLYFNDDKKQDFKNHYFKLTNIPNNIDDLIMNYVKNR